MKLGEARDRSARSSREFLRVSIEDARSREAEGWRFASGWFPFGLTWWAWFSRPFAETDPE